MHILDVFHKHTAIVIVTEDTTLDSHVFASVSSSRRSGGGRNGWRRPVDRSDDSSNGIATDVAVNNAHL